MERLNEDKARIFDNFYCNDNLNMLKICSFFMHEKERPVIAVLIKYMELHICMQKSMKNHEIPTSCNCSGKESNLEDILCEIGDYLPPEGRDMMDKLKDMKENMEMYSQMMEMMSMMNEQSDNNDT
ncbi:MAG: hypothetical protein J6A73_08110 [Lachnospiraceae bacterium]|nr:hypothetical protein [Lachnospiraceae bacterium]